VNLTRERGRLPLDEVLAPELESPVERCLWRSVMPLLVSGIVWVIIIVVLVLLLLGFFGRGRF